MRASTLPSVSFSQFRAWLVAAVILSLSTAAMAVAPAPVYSDNNQYSNATPYSKVSSFESGVQNPGFSADADLSNFATINRFVGILANTSLRLGLSGGGGAAGYRAGVVVGNVSTFNNLLNANALGVITLTTYSGTQFQEQHVVSAEVARGILLGGSRPTQLEFIASLPFDKIEIEVSGAVTVSYKLKVFYAYGVPSLVQPQARGVLSRFNGSGSALAPCYGAGTSNVGIVSVCALAGVSNPERAVDNDLTNYAQFNSLATVSCPSALSVRLEGDRPAPAGFYAGFVIGDSGLLDLSVLSGLRVSTYLNGVATGESATGAGVLELRALPNGQSQVSFPTMRPFNEVKIERVGVLTALDNLNIYYGFGVEPRAFQGTTHTLSDFDPSQTSGKYEVRENAAVCSSDCGVTNPQGAADNDATTFATVTLPTAALATVELQLQLNGVGAAGNRAGMVVGNGQGLLDVSVLDRLTLTTYDANGVVESASGRSLLSLNLLPNGRQELSFLTTRPFTSVQLSVSAGVAALTNFPVYYAFADDRTGGLPSLIVPLPVELTAFSGRWVSGAAELSWATASEKNSSYFIVERSTGAEKSFQAVGRVAAAGNSTSAQAYKLRDAEASAQGAATLYYRLRQVDVDGKETFSSVVSLAVGKQGAASPQLELYPNPAPDAQAVMVHCPNLPATGGTVQAYSQLGQLVGQLPVTEAAAHLPLPALAPGLYYVVLRDANGQQLATQRLMVGGR